MNASQAPTSSETLAARPEFEADLERRFGALRRLYGNAGYARLRSATVAIVGLGGVGSWAAEALARSGVAALVLIDLDHIAESNINRQVQALGATLGQSKVQALRERIQDIHPGCVVHGIEAFVDADNWPALLTVAVDALIDACDQVRAKAALAAWAMAQKLPAVCVGAAGGKRAPQRVEVADLCEVTHDPLLAALRQRLRKIQSAAQGAGASQGESTQHAPTRRSTTHRTSAKLGLRCVFSREEVMPPVQDSDIGATVVAVPAALPSITQGDLSCHGYGSSVTVTATFGMVAASEIVALLLA